MANTCSVYSAERPARSGRLSEVIDNAGAMDQTAIVTWTTVQAGQDHLQQYAGRSPVEALAELVWNGLDAESPRVDVDIRTRSLGTGNKVMEQVDRIVVSDLGHGVTHATALKAFGSLGDSWKKSLGGRSLNGLRVLHGRAGRGRFFAYTLGYRVTWNSVYAEDDTFRRIRIDGNFQRIDGFEISDPSPASGPSGTVVEVEVEQTRSLSTLLREDLRQQLAARLAPHLLGNRDLVVNVNGVALDPAALIDREPTDIPMIGVPDSELRGAEAPVLTVIDWKDSVHWAASLVLCNEGGASLLEVEGPKSSPLKSTGYLKWSQFGKGNVDLLLVDLAYPGVMAAARRALAEHIRARTAEATAHIVDQLKSEGAYPYDGPPTTPVDETEQQMYDLVLVAARQTLLNASRDHRAMSARLLQIALEERPDSLDTILSQTLNLTPEEQRELAEMLSFSPLGRIVGAASEVTQRLDLAAALRHFVYDHDAGRQMREVDQLHPLVRDNIWLFGEDWRLARSEVGLTTILREVLKGEEIALEQDLIRDDERSVLPPDVRGRVDLLLQRSIDDPKRRQRLVVELKRPSRIVGEDELSQVKRYARALAGHPGVGPSSVWTFWLVASATAYEIEDDMTQKGRRRGHIIESSSYDIFVTTWGELLDDAERRLNFYREQLQYDIRQDQAVERVRRRHSDLLPPAGDQPATSST